MKHVGRSYALTSPRPTRPQKCGWICFLFAGKPILSILLILLTFVSSFLALLIKEFIQYHNIGAFLHICMAFGPGWSGHSNTSWTPLEEFPSHQRGPGTWLLVLPCRGLSVCLTTQHHLVSTPTNRLMGITGGPVWLLVVELSWSNLSFRALYIPHGLTPCIPPRMVSFTKMFYGHLIHCSVYVHGYWFTLWYLCIWIMLPHFVFLPF